MRRWLARHILFLLTTMVIVGPLPFVAHAAELDGVEMPDTLQVNGKTLFLNGFGRRTFSILGIDIYVAGLYLEQPTTDPDKFIRSQETRLLAIRFERSVSADDARSTWRNNLQLSCKFPCHWIPKMSSGSLQRARHACGRHFSPSVPSQCRNRDSQRATDWHDLPAAIRGGDAGFVYRLKHRPS